MPDIHLYSIDTPNGVKVSITLEELGLSYDVTKIEFSKDTQKEPWFLEINPNGRIPALTDTFTDGGQIRVFESGSIMQYLVERYDKDYKISFPLKSREHVEMTSWLFFMNSGVGPMQGQSNHFTRYAPEQIPYAVKRYQTETKRLYGVLDKHLGDSDRDYLVGSKCTIADIAHFGWISTAWWAGVDIDQFPHVKAWMNRMWKRPAFKRGAMVAPQDVPEAEVHGEDWEKKFAADTSAWILRGMKDDAERFE